MCWGLGDNGEDDRQGVIFKLFVEMGNTPMYTNPLRDYQLWQMQ